MIIEKIMYLIYLDESWNTWNDLDNKEQPIHFISGIVVPFSKIQEIEKDIMKLDINFLPYSKNFDFEFHWVELAGWKKYFKYFKIEDRLKCIEWLVNIFIKYNIKFFSQWINKYFLKENYKNPYHPHYLSFMYLIEKVDNFLEKEHKKWLIIMDRNLDTEQNIINNFQEYKNHWTSFWFSKSRITSLIDTVYYTDSYNSYLMQLSDVIWYIYSIYKTSDYLGKLENSWYVRKKLFNYFENIKKQAIYIDIEPKRIKKR